MRDTPTLLECFRLGGYSFTTEEEDAIRAELSPFPDPPLWQTARDARSQANDGRISGTYTDDALSWIENNPGELDVYIDEM